VKKTLPRWKKKGLLGRDTSWAIWFKLLPAALWLAARFALGYFGPLHCQMFKALDAWPFRAEEGFH